MKRITLTLILMILGSASILAQRGLNIYPFFTSEYTSNPKVTVVSLSGKQLEDRGLEKYKSISITDDTALADKLSQAVIKDGCKAVEKDVSYRGGQLYFGFYSLGGSGINRRYMLYLNRRPAGKEKSTLIYIEGNLDSASVKAMIK